MAEKEFNLLREPWIKVMRPDGETEEVSLLDVFRRAPEFKGLAGELPTQDVAVLRLLLAVLHAVFGRYDTDGTYAPICSDADPRPSPGDALKRWKALWDRGAFPMGIIEDYLTHYEERFWLFHPERPFYQVAALQSRNDKFGPFEASKLNGQLAESDHKVRLFPQRSGKEKSILKYGEATRWLLWTNAFSETFGKLEAKGKQNKTSPTLGVGWLGKLGLIFAVGNNLFETLLYNYVLQKENKELWSKEKPIWEADTVITNERNEITMPINLSELLTLQSRRLLLKRENDNVTGYFLTSGDFFSEINAFSEQMTIWRNTAKREGDQPEYHPKRHDPSRQIWRDFSALVSQSESRRRPGVVSWLALLKSEGYIPRSHFCFQTAGVSYGTMMAVIDDTFSDSISFNAKLLTALGENWTSRIIDEIGVTENLVAQVGFLEQNLAKAEGDADGGSRKNAAKEQAYFRLDMPFRRWLESIDPEKDEMSEACDRWWEEERRIVRMLGRELVEQAGPQAFVGRTVVEDKKERRYTAPEAYNYFLYRTSTRQALKGGDKK